MLVKTGELFLQKRKEGDCFIAWGGGETSAAAVFFSLISQGRFNCTRYSTIKVIICSFQMCDWRPRGVHTVTVLGT